VAVSNARISIAQNRDNPRAALAVLEAHGGTRRRQRARSRFWPFDEDDRVVEVRLEIAPLRRRDVTEAKQVEMRDVDAPVVTVPDRERRARHRLRHAESAARTAHERRLSGAELAGDGDDIPELQLDGELGRKLFRLVRGMRLSTGSQLARYAGVSAVFERLHPGGRGQKRPSW